MRAQHNRERLMILLVYALPLIQVLSEIAEVAGLPFTTVFCHCPCDTKQEEYAQNTTVQQDRAYLPPHHLLLPLAPYGKHSQFSHV